MTTIASGSPPASRRVPAIRCTAAAARTGGYGHGRAIDITSAEGDPEPVWKWLDQHGAKYGLHRPMPGADPAHVQPVGEWHKSSVATRDARSRTAAATHGRHKRNKLKFARAGR